jgi:hypothetical protein
MRRVFLVVVVMLATMLTPASVALATIHPIVESIDCASASAFAHHPSGDVANPPGQTPGAAPGNGDFKALSNASPSAFSDFKNNGTCGNQP